MGHRSSSRRTATKRCRSAPALVPGSHGSTSIPPQARVEWTRVSASPANATWVMPLLDRLEKEEGVVLGLLTGNMARGAALKLRAGGLDPGRFLVGAYGSDSAHRPELPPIAARRAERYFGRIPQGPEVIIIGDTPADLACGACINARAIGVATGAYSLADLMSCAPHAAFETLSDADQVLEAIFAPHVS